MNIAPPTHCYKIDPKSIFWSHWTVIFPVGIKTQTTWTRVSSPMDGIIIFAISPNIHSNKMSLRFSGDACQIQQNLRQTFGNGKTRVWFWPWVQMKDGSKSIHKTIHFLFNENSFQVASTVLMHVERRKGFITSGILFIFWFLLFLAGIVPFYSKILQALDVVSSLKTQRGIFPWLRKTEILYANRIPISQWSKFMTLSTCFWHTKRELTI